MIPGMIWPSGPTEPPSDPLGDRDGPEDDDAELDFDEEEAIQQAERSYEEYIGRT